MPSHHYETQRHTLTHLHLGQQIDSKTKLQRINVSTNSLPFPLMPLLHPNYLNNKTSVLQPPHKAPYSLHLDFEGAIKGRQVKSERRHHSRSRPLSLPSHHKPTRIILPSPMKLLPLQARLCGRQTFKVESPQLHKQAWPRH